MPLKRSTLTLELLFAQGDKPPTEFCVFKPGLWETTKGIFKFTAASLERCMKAAADYGNDLSIDYDHAMFDMFKVDPAMSGRAAGWFTPEARNGALFATNVRWTPAATKMLADREYRYFSPAFTHDDGGEIHELFNVALTNMPATKHQDPLMASRGAGEPTHRETHTMNPTLIALLGLAANATEADIVAAIQALKSNQAELLSMTGAKDAAGMRATALAWQQSHAQVATLSAKVAAHEKALELAELNSLIEQGKTDGKVTPAMEKTLRDSGVDFTKTFLSIAPVVVAKKEAKEPKSTDTIVTLTKEERHMAKLMGQDTKKFAENKAKRLEKIAERSGSQDDDEDDE